MSSRGIALLSCAAGGVLALTAAGRPWVTLDVQAAPELPRVIVDSSGGDLAPALAPLALVGLAAVAALLATRGALRRVVGLLVLLAGAGVMLAAAAGSRATPDVTGTVVSLSRTGWPWVALAGGLLLLAGGLLTAVRGGSWAALSRRYQPAEPRPSDRQGDASAPVEGEAALWDALDRGQDPTVPLAPRPASPARDGNLPS